VKPDRLAIARDLFLLTPRLARACARVQWQQWFGRPQERLRKFTAVPWLAAQLRVAPECIAGAHIEEVHTGTASRSRLHIDYAGSPVGPTSLFIKSRAPDFGSVLFGVLFDLGGNEVNFYRHLRSESPVKSPEVFHCEGGSADYVMLLEDLTDRDCSFRDLASKCSAEEARLVVATLARLHAAFWDSPRFDTDLSWVKRYETNRDHRMLELVRQVAVPIAFEKYGDVLPNEIRAVVPHLMEKYLRLEEQWARGPRSLLHGDAHLGNMYFQAGEAGLLDWQVCQLGQGMRDVGYFLINSLDEEIRAEHQDALIRHYLATLAGHGVTLDFETAWHQYRLQSVYAWIAGVVTAPSNFQPESVVAAGLSRACKAILDLDAIELIREL
jgi:thiamine kinase-like enzyme